MFSSLKISKLISSIPVSGTSFFSTSSVQYKRIGKRVRNAPEWKRLKLASGPWWRKDPIVMRAPLARTEHPRSRFSQLEEEIYTEICANTNARVLNTVESYNQAMLPLGTQSSANNSSIALSTR